MHYEMCSLGLLRGCLLVIVFVVLHLLVLVLLFRFDFKPQWNSKGCRNHHDHASSEKSALNGLPVEFQVVFDLVVATVFWSAIFRWRGQVENCLFCADALAGVIIFIILDYVKRVDRSYKVFEVLLRICLISVRSDARFSKSFRLPSIVPLEVTVIERVGAVWVPYKIIKHKGNVALRLNKVFSPAKSAPETIFIHGKPHFRILSFARTLFGAHPLIDHRQDFLVNIVNVRNKHRIEISIARSFCLTQRPESVLSSR